MLFVILLRKFPFRRITKVQIAAAAESLETHVDGLFKNKFLTWEKDGNLLPVPRSGSWGNRCFLGPVWPGKRPTDIAPMDSPIERLPDSDHSECGAISSQASFSFMAPCKDFSIV